jgi:plastocyanin
LTVRITQAVRILAVALCFVSVAASERADPKTYTVTIEGMRFQPEVLSVSRGDTIVWVNRDLVPHTATSKAGRFDSKTIGADESWKHTASTKGDFTYICTFHPAMKARLRVR